jgi:hypothetical protein
MEVLANSFSLLSGEVFNEVIPPFLLFIFNTVIFAELILEHSFALKEFRIRGRWTRRRLERPL